MRFLFIGPGFPGATGTSPGSGIGSHLQTLTGQLVKREHECHVIVWGMQSGVRSQKQDARQLKNAIPLQCPCQDIAGVKVFLLPHAYWPVIERILPDSRDVWNLKQLVRRLEAEFHYDWIEIQSEEGIATGVQRDFPGKTLLRVHTTLRQMVEYKGEAFRGQGRVQGSGFRVRGSGESKSQGWRWKSWKLAHRLWRERRSLLTAGRILVSSKSHATEMKRLYPGIVEPEVIHLGTAPQGNQAAAIPDQSIPVFLIVGTADRRKGFDRIRPVLEAYSRQFGPCKAVIVARADEIKKAEFGLTGVNPVPGVRIDWKAGLSDAELTREYGAATVYLHLARYESFGLPLIEAASHGVPVVSTPVGVARELLEGQLAGFLVDGDDASAVSAALAAAKGGRDTLGEMLSKRYRESFSSDMVADKYLSLLALPGCGRGKRDIKQAKMLA